MSSSFLDNCREDLRVQGQHGYLAGYDSGRARFDERMRMQSQPAPAPGGPPPPQWEASPIPPATLPPAAGIEAPLPPPAVNNNTGIQINIGTGPNPYPPQPAPVVPPPNPKAWFCQVRAFMSDFNSFGPTRLEAYQLTLQACVRQYAPMHCQEIQCQPNQ